MLTLAQWKVVLLRLDAVCGSCHLLRQDINCAPYRSKFLQVAVQRRECRFGKSIAIAEGRLGTFLEVHDEVCRKPRAREALVGLKGNFILEDWRLVGVKAQTTIIRQRGHPAGN